MHFYVLFFTLRCQSAVKQSNEIARMIEQTLK
jgi:hypothetical protein